MIGLRGKIGARVVGGIVVSVHEIPLAQDLELAEGFVVQLESRVEHADEKGKQPVAVESGKTMFAAMRDALG